MQRPVQYVDLSEDINNLLASKERGYQVLHLLRLYRAIIDARKPASSNKIDLDKIGSALNEFISSQEIDPRARGIATAMLAYCQPLTAKQKEQLHADLAETTKFNSHLTLAIKALLVKRRSDIKIENLNAEKFSGFNSLVGINPSEAAFCIDLLDFDVTSLVGETHDLPFLKLLVTMLQPAQINAISNELISRLKKKSYIEDGNGYRMCNEWYRSQLTTFQWLIKSTHLSKEEIVSIILAFHNGFNKVDIKYSYPVASDFFRVIPDSMALELIKLTKGKLTSGFSILFHLMFLHLFSEEEQKLISHSWQRVFFGARFSGYLKSESYTAYANVNPKLDKSLLFAENKKVLDINQKLEWYVLSAKKGACSLEKIDISQETSLNEVDGELARKFILEVANREPKEVVGILKRFITHLDAKQKISLFFGLDAAVPELEEAVKKLPTADFDEYSNSDALVNLYNNTKCESVSKFTFLPEVQKTQLYRNVLFTLTEDRDTDKAWKTIAVLLKGLALSELRLGALLPKLKSALTSTNIAVVHAALTAYSALYFKLQNTEQALDVKEHAETVYSLLPQLAQFNARCLKPELAKFIREFNSEQVLQALKSIQDSTLDDEAKERVLCETLDVIRLEEVSAEIFASLPIQALAFPLSLASKLNEDQLIAVINAQCKRNDLNSLLLLALLSQLPDESRIQMHLKLLRETSIASPWMVHILFSIKRNPVVTDNQNQSQQLCIDEVCKLLVDRNFKYPLPAIEAVLANANYLKSKNTVDVLQGIYALLGGKDVNLAADTATELGKLLAITLENSTITKEQIEETYFRLIKLLNNLPECTTGVTALTFIIDDFGGEFVKLQYPLLEKLSKCHKGTNIFYSFLEKIEKHLTKDQVMKLSAKVEQAPPPQPAEEPVVAKEDEKPAEEPAVIAKAMTETEEYKANVLEIIMDADSRDMPVNKLYSCLVALGNDNATNVRVRKKEAINLVSLFCEMTASVTNVRQLYRLIFTLDKGQENPLDFLFQREGKMTMSLNGHGFFNFATKEFQSCSGSVVTIMNIIQNRLYALKNMQQAGAQLEFLHDDVNDDQFLRQTGSFWRKESQFKPVKKEVVNTEHHGFSK